MNLPITESNNLPFKAGEFETLCEGLDYAALSRAECSFFSSQGVLEQVLTYRELRERAVDLALRLTATKLDRGARVGIIAETNPDYLIFFFGCQYAGLVPVPMPLNVNIGSHATYVQRLATMLKAADVSAAMASPDWIDFLRDAAKIAGLGFVGTPAEFYQLSQTSGELRPNGKDDPCYIQYSSGSTSLPKGALATQRSVTNNARDIGQFGLRLHAGDSSTSWLPLYHDMGLVGFCITPMLSQISVDYLATASFARRPLTWLKLISERRSTISFSPTFGYGLCVRAAARRNTPELDLSSWRVAGIGGEMIRPAMLEAFTETFAPAGFDARAFLPSYGLAEATLAVSFGALNTGVRTDRRLVNGNGVNGNGANGANGNGANGNGANGNGANGANHTIRDFAICGRPLPNLTVEIRGDDSQPLPEGQMGQVFVRGPNLMDGYFRDQAATDEVLSADGWLNTGDLGYMRNGELIITGRRKDLIILNGRNIWPQDIEWAVEQLPDIRAGGVAAFSADEDGAERVVVVIETRVSKPEDLLLLEKQIYAAVHRAAGVNSEVVLVPPRSLSFTSSGKLRRAGTQERLEAGEIRSLNHRAPPHIDPRAKTPAPGPLSATN